MTMTIYHNPDCGTSRNTLAMIRASGEEPVVVEYLKVGWTPELLRSLADRAGEPLRALIRQLVTRLRTASDVRATGHTASALLHEAVANFNPSTLATVPEKTASLLAFIAKNPEASLSNAALAKYAGLSEGAFIRWFHAEVGTTPAVHVQQMRMKTAAHALLTTSRSIEDIASSVGFKNRHHFTRVFRQHFHFGPAAYRKK